MTADHEHVWVWRNDVLLDADTARVRQKFTCDVPGCDRVKYMTINALTGRQVAKPTYHTPAPSRP